ncbi:MAG TPA: serine/threonine-protein kinase [Ktedonobacterales bacterium]
MIKCTNCNTENNDTAQTCVKCQQPLTGAGRDPISAPPPPPPGESDSGESHARGPKRLTSGTTLQKRYQIEKAVAKGGMGAVYRGTDQHFKKACAVKEMLDNFSSDEDRDQALQWFEREAHMLLELHHPAIPRVFDFFAENGHNYLVMEFIDGKTLGEVLEQEGQPRGLPEARARSWGAQICNVLAYLHGQNPPVIFRDLKPSNIMIDKDDKVKLIDFGIARSFQGGGHQATVIMTLGYAPPEQLEGKPSPRSDLYALGATLHRLLTRHEATNNKPSIFDFPTIRSIRPEISPQFDGLIGKALQKNLDARWASAGEMEQAILRLPPVVAGPPVQAAPGASLLNRPPVPLPGQLGQPSVMVQPSVAVAPSSGPSAGYINMALAQLDQRRFTEAFNIAQQALQIDPRNPQVHKLMGKIYARSQPPDTTRAMAAYQTALSLNPSDAETHRLIGDVFLFLQRRPAPGIEAYQNALRYDPNDGEAHRLLGQCYEQTNQLDPALAEYREAARLLNRSVAVHMNIGRLCLRLNRLQDAERGFVEALRLEAGNAEARYLLCQVYEREGRLNDAVRECEYAVRLNPADGQAQQNLQRLRARLATGNPGSLGGPGTLAR